MKRLFIATILIISACDQISNFSKAKEQPIKQIQGEITFATAQQQQQALDQELGDHIIRTMNHVNSPLTPIKRQLLAQMLVQVANNTFETMDQKKDWIRVLGIESKFDNTARSPVNATGIGQIMPQFVLTFGKYCGLKGLVESDVEDVLVNTTLSACVWRRMLETVPDHSVILALSAYNSGPSSSSTKNIQKLGSAVPETANYITRFSYLKEVTDNPKDKANGKNSYHGK